MMAFLSSEISSRFMSPIFGIIVSMTAVNYLILCQKLSCVNITVPFKKVVLCKLIFVVSEINSWFVNYLNLQIPTQMFHHVLITLYPNYNFWTGEWLLTVFNK